MSVDRDKFFDSVRERPFGGSLSQLQVDGLSRLLDTWEKHFAASHPNDGTMFLAYALATAYHETAATMRPIEEYGQGSGHDYGKPVDPYGNAYYGRGHVQLTWLTNYEKGESILRDKYEVDAPLVKYPHRMLEDETSALVLFDGSISGWFTGVGLPKFFNKAKHIENSYDARTVINGHDQASKIQGYYDDFKVALA